MPFGGQSYDSTHVFVPPSDSIQRSELGQRDTQIHELTEKYSSERETRALTEQERDQLGEQLVGNQMVEFQLITFICYIPIGYALFFLLHFVQFPVQAIKPL